MDITQSKRIDDGVFEVEHTVSETKKQRYSVDELLIHRQNIQAQRDRDNAQRDRELADVDLLLKEAAKLGFDQVLPAKSVPVAKAAKKR